MNENQQQFGDNLELKIKVCGLTQIDQIRDLTSLQTDFLGFIFYKLSPRFVLDHLSLKEISEISHHAKVGVFVNEDLGRVLEIAQEADLNFIQLHGDEDEEYVLQLRQRLNENIKLIKVIRIGNQNPNELQNIIDKQIKTTDFLLFDTDSKAFGGTGKTFDWNILNRIKIPIPYFISGGISLENVSEVENLKQKPFALDINSKFEIVPGIKDLEKIKALISCIKI